MTQIAVVYFSGYGHTAKQAEAIAAGAAAAPGAIVSMLPIDPQGELPEGGWDTLAASDAIIIGSPTYMGAPAWQFKKFADASSKPWFQMLWRDKVAGAFTNSASINGDKGSTIAYLMTFAMQHGMIYVGTAQMPSNNKAASRNDINYLGAFSGAIAQSPSDSSPDEGPAPGDLETAKLYGQRVAQIAGQLRA